jgi:hypothetical protein
MTPPTESTFELTQIGADPRDGSMAFFGTFPAQCSDRSDAEIESLAITEAGG